MFALSFCLVTLEEDLSIVVSPVATVAVAAVAVVGTGAISVISVVGISLGLSIGGPLSIVGIRVSSVVSSVSVVESRVSIGMIGTISIDEGISLRLGISRSLSVVVGIRVSSVVSSVAVVES